jgi:hypothetical protein
MHDVIVIIAGLVNLVALGGFAYWARGWFTALKGAVDAQKETIAAQKEFIEGLRTILDATDTPKMFERFEAYKKLVDQEKEAFQQNAEHKLTEQREWMSATEIAVSKAMSTVISSYINIIGALMPYAPRNARTAAVEATSLDKGFKETLLTLADHAPNLPRFDFLPFETPEERGAREKRLSELGALLSGPPALPKFEKKE